MRRAIYLWCMVALIIGWLIASIHFFNVLTGFVEAEMQRLNPVLYVAVESWGLLCILVSTILAVRLIEVLLLE